VHRVRRVARTLADLDGVSGAIGAEHVGGALELRVAFDVLAPSLAS
jgi:predicted ATPase with chaperone activity